MVLTFHIDIHIVTFNVLYIYIYRKQPKTEISICP